MPDVSIAISAQDNYSSTIKKMSNYTQPFRKDLEWLQKDLNTLSNTRVDLKVDLVKARRELSEAQKSFTKLGDAASEANLKTAQAKFDNLQSNLGKVTKTLGNTKRAMDDLNKPGGGSGDGSGLFSTLGKAGAFKMLGDTAGQLASTYVGSAFGNNGSTMFSSILAGAGSGAAIGSMVPGLGTVVGGIAGGAVGAISGGAQIFGKKDDAFKGYVSDQYGAITAENKTILNSGSAIAANREMTQVSFSTMFKDPELAKSFLGKVNTMSNSTPFLFDDLTHLSKKLASFGFEESELLPTLTSIGDAGAALGMDTQKMESVTTALGKMRMLGKVYNDDLQRLTDAGISSYEILSDALGISKEQLSKKASEGKISGESANKIILEYFNKNYAGAMEAQGKTFAGKQSTLTGMQQEQSNAMGEGYNKKRLGGIQKEIDRLDPNSDSGKRMARANSAIGEWKAHLENERERFIREEQEKITKTTDYIDAVLSKDGVTQGMLLQRAEANGINKFNASADGQRELEYQKTLIRGIADDASINSDYYDAGHKLGEVFSEGLAAAMLRGTKKAMAENPMYFTSSAPTTYSGQAAGQAAYVPTMYSGQAAYVPPSSAGRGHAYGLPFVPYDNYPAILHRGERVLTAADARGGEGGSSVTITGNNITVREEADVYKIAQELVAQIKRAKEVYNGT